MLLALKLLLRCPYAPDWQCNFHSGPHDHESWYDDDDAISNFRFAVIPVISVVSEQSLKW